MFTFSIVYLYFQLRVLHVAGCGLVSNFLLDKLATVAECEFSALSRLTSLVYLSYEDEPAVQSCEGRVLSSTLQGDFDNLQDEPLALIPTGLGWWVKRSFGYFVYVMLPNCHACHRTYPLS